MKLSMATLVTLLIVSVLVAPAVLADSDGDHMDGWSMMDGWGSGMGALWLLSIIFIAVAIVIWFIQVLSVNSDRRRGMPPRSSADHVLDDRYARGELDAEEYHRMKNDLYRFR